MHARADAATENMPSGGQAEIEANAAGMQDLSSGPRFASIKIDSANLERELSNRDGSFIVTRIRSALGYRPI